MSCYVQIGPVPDSHGGSRMSSTRGLIIPAATQFLHNCMCMRACSSVLSRAHALHRACSEPPILRICPALKSCACMPEWLPRWLCMHLCVHRNQTHTLHLHKYTLATSHCSFLDCRVRCLHTYCHWWGCHRQWQARCLAQHGCR